MRKISRILFSWYVYQRTAYFVPAAQAHLPMGNATDQGHSFPGKQTSVTTLTT